MLSLLAVALVQEPPGQPKPFPWVFEPGALPKLLALTVLALLLVGFWTHMRPCDTCGEYRPGCRCKPREYDKP